MAAYVIFEEQILDPERMDGYRSLAGPSIRSSGGKVLSRGERVTPLEGEWSPQRVAVLEFPSVEQGKAWYDSSDYQEAIRAREGVMVAKALVVAGA